MKYDSDNQRVHRISSVIRKEIAKIIQNDINDQRIKDVIITDVEMSKDLKNARIFFIVFNNKDSNMDLRPLAPVFLLIAFCAISLRAVSLNVSLAPSNLNSS